eukprot:CAMPEP_0113689856 /NCGR_PEP_ID=MMETSP0038_2-20120614/17428_1 /TAXON_ID=2898 /ORGANISM="Cryptomonas paramecium" /LENGTH=58 /DNA_ID=CAMNT_0000611037 /DNA_START=280 /DNA_END=456 /DNA_ORIENTATION=+ /assembly_acc=CAM_ASM_000170
MIFIRQQTAATLSKWTMRWAGNAASASAARVLENTVSRERNANRSMLSTTVRNRAYCA